MDNLTIEVFVPFAVVLLNALVGAFGVKPTVDKIKKLFPKLTGDKTLLWVFVVTVVMSGLTTFVEIWGTGSQSAPAYAIIGTAFLTSQVAYWAKRA